MVKTIKVPIGWERTPLSKVLVERTEQKGKTDVEIYSVAVNKGVVNQVEHLGRSYAAEDTSNYNLVSFGDIVYTKSPTGDFPYGIVKQSHVKQDVAVSPLYGVYKPGNFYLGLFLDYYFQSHINANNYLKKIVNKGAKNTILVSNQVFLHNCILLPNDVTEQQKIVEILMTQDKVIALKEKLLEAKKKQKKWLMQKFLMNQNWQKVKLEELFNRLLRKNVVGNGNVLTISANHGLISQESYFKKSIASSDLSNYFLLYKGDFAYNKSYSENYPYGAIKRLDKYEMGVVSPLYICFTPTFSNKCPEFYMHYFESLLLDREIKAISQEGARNHGLLNIAIDDFFSMGIPFPPVESQQKIAQQLSVADKEIELLAKDLELQKSLKQYLMQQLLTGKIRV